MAGARWVDENILQAHPDADLDVYVVWMPMLPFDSRRAWDEGVMADPRVAHVWDEKMIVGGWLGENAGEIGLGPSEDVVWDTYLLFDEKARWGDVPAPLIGSGASVIAEAERLEGEISPYL